MGMKEKKTVHIYLMAFAVPFIIMLTTFALLKIYPFGDRQVLVVDAWNQYYPFLVELARKLKSGESLLYCWRLGLGTDFVSLIAYYLASPLNLLTVFIPADWLREAFTFLILIKIGLAGSFCAYSLHKINGRDDCSVIIFSAFYALCGWTIGYYWNIMWLDTFAVFPLVAAGIFLLVKEKKYRLYTISLAAAIIMNYYIGFMVCMFTVIFFFVQCAVHRNERKALGRNLRNIILFSALSVMMSAIVTLPAWVGLQSAYKSGNAPTGWSVVRGWAETIFHSMAYVKPTAMGGNPYLYSGLLSIILLFAFYRLGKVSVREKAAYTAAIMALLISTNVNVLDYIWHGFHVTNSLPYRYTFLFSFLMVMLAYKGFSGMDMLRKKDGIFVCAGGALYFFVIAADQIYRYKKEHGTAVSVLGMFQSETMGMILLKNLLLLIIYMTIVILAVEKKLKRKATTLLLAVAAGLELVPSVVSGIGAVGTTDRTVYPNRYEEVKEALTNMEAMEGKNGFYRTEFAKKHGWNDPALYGYYGTAFFSSTANGSVTEVFEQMGLVAWQAANRYYALDSTPVNNAFLNLKYFISCGTQAVCQEYLTPISQSGDTYVYRNEAYLPIGFMVEKEMADFNFEGETPFEIQNNLLKTAAGTEENVFEALDMIHVGHRNLYVTRQDYGIYHYQPSEDADESEKGKFKYNYEMPEDGCAYAFMDLRPEGKAENTASILFNGDSSDHIIYENGSFFPAGTYKKGEIFSVSSEIGGGRAGDLRVFVSIFRQDAFERAYDRLKDETLDVWEYTSRGLKGTIKVRKDNLLYTSIPYDRGWKVYVDGERKDATLIAGAMMGVELTEGEHTVEFVYSPMQVYMGMFLSILAIGIFGMISVLDRKGRLKWL
jgi:uncharacterized membrane protein YfhO